MTKLVRIENADTSNFKVVVEVWDKAYPEGSGKPDTLVHEYNLDYPTAMTDSMCYLTSTRYIVVREKPAEVTS